MESLLQVSGLRKHYGKIAAVDGVDLELRRGEILGLLGPNGAGKTSTLECILGLRQADAGTIRIDGIDALAEPRRVRPLIGAQLQANALPDKMTPRQALRLFSSFYEHRPDIEGLLERFGLREKAESPFHVLSGGQQQRLTLALAFVHAPSLLVLDEPTAGLDPAARKELLEIVLKSRDEGCGILMSTHELDEAERFCDRIAIIDDACVIAQGTPAQIVSGIVSDSQIRLRTSDPIASERLLALPGVSDVSEGDGQTLIQSSDAASTVMALSRIVLEAGKQIESLEIRTPRLEDAFLELTGRKWPSTAGGGASGVCA